MSNVESMFLELSRKLDASAHAQRLAADETLALRRAHEQVQSRLILVEESVATASATARAAIDMALKHDAARAELHQSVGELAGRLANVEHLVTNLSSDNAGQAQSVALTLSETRRQTPMIRGMQDRTARYAALASAFGTGFAYAFAELIRHFLQ